MASTRVLLYADSGQKSGLGHVQRCLALAAALRECGVECRFRVPDVDTVRGRIEGAGFPVEAAFGGADDLIAIADGAAVVVDSYGVDGGTLRRLRDAGLLVALLDDHPAFPIPCQLCINGGAGAESLPYRSAGGRTRFLLGLRYAMLQPDLWEAEPRPRTGPVENVLVTLGGTDPHGLAPEILEALDGLAQDFAVTLAVGPYFAGQEALADVARGCRRSVVLLEAPATLVAAMRAADLAVSAAGQTLYELARLGVPTVAIELADNQRATLEAFEARRAVQSAGRVGDPSLAGRIADEVGALLSSAEARVTLAATASALLDGQGASRVAAELCGLMATSRHDAIPPKAC
jgi:spore coat polysaccharide biosynthesis predicted glycosyltransferase SpsG